MAIDTSCELHCMGLVFQPSLIVHMNLHTCELSDSLIDNIPVDIAAELIVGENCNYLNISKVFLEMGVVTRR